MKTVIKATLDNHSVSQSATYNNGELAFFDRIQSIVTNIPIKTDVYVIGLVIEGKVATTINGQKYEALKNDIFICTPNDIIVNGYISIDLKCYVICVSPTYFQKIAPISSSMWDTKVFFEKNPMCSLLPEEAVIFCQYYDILCSKIHQSTPVQGKVIDTLMLAFLYDMQYVLSRLTKVNHRPFSSGETLFKRFLQLLEKSNPKYQSVSYYADRLCVTPKYLSAVCKQASNMTASDMIDKYVIKDIEYMIKHTAKSIKEIASELNFSNLSFFGKYVKKHLGMSPREYRAQSLRSL